MMAVSRSMLSRRKGMTLIELIVAFTILLLISSMAVPLARSRVRKIKEHDLRAALADIRTAIDKYKDAADSNKLGPQKQDGYGYPESLEALVNGVKAAGAAGSRRASHCPSIWRNVHTTAVGSVACRRRASATASSRLGHGIVIQSNSGS